MKVLIVDDSTLLQKSMMESLKKIDSEMMVSQAFDCRQAVELFKSSVPDTVILDIELPDGSGVQLLKKFKEERPAVNVIVFTNYSTNEFRRGCLDLHAYDFIDKSDLNKLLKIINTMN